MSPAVVFSDVLLRPDPSAAPDALPPHSIPSRKMAFVAYLLEEITPEAGV